MKHFNVIISCVCVLLFFPSVRAQEQTKNNDSILHHAIGWAAGMSTGFGIGYRYTSNGLKTIQVAFAPFYAKDMVLNSLGITFMQSLRKTENSQLFIYQGNSFFYTFERYEPYITEITETKEQNISSTEQIFENNASYYSENYMYNLGVGFGVEYLCKKHISLNFMVGYSFQNNFKQLGITVETGVFYKL